MRTRNKWRYCGGISALAAAFMMIPGLLCAQSEVITLERLMDEMTELEWLTHSPDPGEREFQFSSYDRRSRIENGERQDWFANVDRGYYLREEKTERGLEYVMADYNGPGVIVRIWSANAGKGIWRIYLDDNPEPVIEGVGRRLLGGKVKPFGPAFAQRRNLGFNMIFPIPFQKSCKVTLSPPGNKPEPQKLGRYYHINIRAYPEGTPVETFQPKMLEDLAFKIKDVAEKLTSPSISAPKEAIEKSFSLTVSPGEERVFGEFSGPAAIYGLEIDLNDPGGKSGLNRLLQECVISAYWDDEGKPGIWSPLGAFFGTSPGVNPYNSLPLEMQKTPEGVKLISRWVMPFDNSAVLRLANYSDVHLQIQGRAVVAHRDWDNRSLYFHAGFRMEEFYPTRPLSDWTMLSVRGTGRFVGMELSIRNPDPTTWWGEGDEKVYVDGEEFPSTFGTGTEDYFGYAWGTDWKTFWHAYHGVTRKLRTSPLAMAFFGFNPIWKPTMLDPNRGDICSQYRWQILDNIPFQESLRFDMEVWHWTQTITVDLTAVAYWYARPGSSHDVSPISGADLSQW